jgi:hypothetical protein
LPFQAARRQPCQRTHEAHSTSAANT